MYYSASDLSYGYLLLTPTVHVQSRIRRNRQTTFTNLHVQRVTVKIASPQYKILASINTNRKVRGFFGHILVYSHESAQA